METQNEFIERRRTARIAATTDIDKDPLVMQVRQQWQDAQDVMKRMREYRLATQETTNVK